LVTTTSLFLSFWTRTPSRPSTRDERSGVRAVRSAQDLNRPVAWFRRNRNRHLHPHRSPETTPRLFQDLPPLRRRAGLSLDQPVQRVKRASNRRGGAWVGKAQSRARASKQSTGGDSEPWRAIDRGQIGTGGPKLGPTLRVACLLVCNYPHSSDLVAVQLQ